MSCEPVTSSLHHNMTRIYDIYNDASILSHSMATSLIADMTGFEGQF